MATYSLAFNPDRSTYEVEMQDDAGGRAVFGFQTEAAAQQWIAEDRRTDVSVNQTQNPELGPVRGDRTNLVALPGRRPRVVADGEPGGGVAGCGGRGGEGVRGERGATKLEIG